MDKENIWGTGNYGSLGQVNFLVARFTQVILDFLRRDQFVKRVIQCGLIFDLALEIIKAFDTVFGVATISTDHLTHVFEREKVLNQEFLGGRCKHVLNSV